MSEVNDVVRFDELSLNDAVLSVIAKDGYEQPTPIQAAMIPHMLAGTDVIGQAQTGTGKTAAFALPLLSGIDLQAGIQVLVLAPTRELALQVAEAFKHYGSSLPGLRVATLCGGMDYRSQLADLRAGAQVVVGTPGRVVDHINRGTLKLEKISAVVLDEADEMLRMGFIDDVELVLGKTSDTCQVALFSATMPAPIRRLAQKYLKKPQEVTIQNKTQTVTTIRQRYLFINQRSKREALVRVLEVEPFDGVILFARTKESTVELADFLQQAGFRATALNGDMAQPQREQVVDQLKRKRFDILVATDVVARGLDVPRISMVLNFDIPFDAETYVHRIGRTGRAGREGDAILFVTPREKRMLATIERVTRQKVTEMPLPDSKQINAVRRDRFKARIADVLAGSKLDEYRQMVAEFQHESNADPLDIAAALARLVQGETPLLVGDMAPVAPERASAGKPMREKRPGAGKKTSSTPDKGMERFRIEVGHTHGAKPGNIVGAIANEIGLDSQHIGRIEIYPGFSTVDLPSGISSKQFTHLKKVRVAGQMLKISKDMGPGNMAVAAGKARTEGRRARA